MEQHRKNLKKGTVVISVPFLRVARFLLTPKQLAEYAEYESIVLVCAPDLAVTLTAVFEQPVEILSPTQKEQQDLSSDRLIRLSDFIRRLLYFSKSNFHGVRFYRSNILGVNLKNSPRKNFFLRYFGRLLSFLVCKLPISRRNWKAFENQVFALRRRDSEFLQRLSVLLDGSDTTVVSSCNWGFQDRAIAALRPVSTFSKMIPYTTDQLLITGYLIDDYDEIQVKGTFEKEQLKDRHGSIEANVDYLTAHWWSVNRRKATLGNGDFRILYAGTSPSYYPRESEVRNLKTIVSALAQVDSMFVLEYRPVNLLKEEILDLDLPTNIANVNFQVVLPDISLVGLSTSPGMVNLYQDWNSYSQKLENNDLLVMSLVSSMAVDYSLIRGGRIIACMEDATGRLSEMSVHEYAPLFCPELADDLTISKSKSELVAALLLAVSGNWHCSPGRYLANQWSVPAN